jgi:methionyl-tRNA formyltransferase
MRVVLITQNDVFYLPDALRYLINSTPSHSQIVGAVVLSVSPYGKRLNFAQKAMSTLKIFGIAFFLRYAWDYVKCKLVGKDVINVLSEHQVPIIQLSDSINSKESLAVLCEYKPDLLVSIAGNQIFKQPLIDLPEIGTLNLHTALLPKYRGLMPSFWVLKNGERNTGVSVFFVDQGIDSGPILVQKELSIGDKSQEELIIATKKLGMEAIIEALNLIHDDNYTLIDNDDDRMSYYTFPTRDDVKEFKRAGKRFF